ncbi:MAG: helix-turn-helix domain-containing protein, partial [Chitinophagales bacterium]
MTFTQILQWIDQGEGTTIEFKMQVTHVSKIAKTLCAFANTKGGTMVVGITDDGEMVGVINPEQTKTKLLQAAMMSELPIVIQLDEFEVESSVIIIAAYVPRSNHKPHHITNTEGLKRAYVRTGDKTMIASPIVKKAIQLAPPENNSDKLSLDSKESGLLKRLEVRPKITLKEYMNLMNISKRRAKRI